MRAFLLLALCVTISPSTFAEDKPTLDANRLMSIRYGSPSWNLDSTKIDSAQLVLKDRKTGKIVQIQLEETEPDSAQFTGYFSVNVGDAATVSPEIFVPPQNLRGKKTDYKKLYQSIQAGKLPRKPLIMKKDEKGETVLEVYDTRDQAARALKAYEAEQALAEKMNKQKLIKPLPSKSSLEAEQQAQHKAALDKLAMEAAQRESDRVRLEQIEKQKEQERLQKAAQASARERKARQKKAQALAREALSLYDQGEYPQAEEKFRQSVDLDPSDKSNYFKYGVCLYKNQKFNEALVVLKLAQPGAAEDLERQYYMGLAYYRLGELDNADKTFAGVAASHDPTLGPSALFYQGVLAYSQERYDAAKKDFETVIDTSSNDPRMDQQAEDYLDKIASAMLYQKIRQRKWNISATVGVEYDSNVTLSPTNSAAASSSTNIADGRAVTAAEVNYRPIFNEHNEWSADLSANLTNSSKNAAAIADPWLYDASLPYVYKGVLWKKGYQLTVRPATELLYMDPYGTGTKELILNSYLIGFDNTFVMSDTWFSTYSFEIRYDDARTADSVGADNEDAMKYTIGTVQSFYLDKAKKEGLSANVDFVQNSAMGVNKNYRQTDFGISYVRPTIWKSSLSASLTGYQINYYASDSGRADLDVALTLGFTKPIRDWVSWTTTANYTKNNSNQTANEYDKYVVMTSASFSTGF